MAAQANRCPECGAGGQDQDGITCAYCREDQRWKWRKEQERKDKLKK